ncbi:phosphoribosyltransferase family protein [Coraliomargarita sp. SDUM461003]|uniref:Phosphoribosyltransferase family protein n=1 Tax=Thalassobacterium maritimum TaxID=3041265 RepID=A0ABU1ANY1_9BACT|nr:phosphoribosyltransferase family protein [Coraliomargarita sp. SDUM461003]MBT63876.1 phosphoribosyltransferase [Puniceicoccaceae bacterium]MDQ8205887.1 phosphoribosyltransferase family protein [Coraliomargarita sp. SDUM461003]HBR94805.1 phosphoribosyltransferase [Opitutae bacterium]|tara:strand:- start:7092 stop:7649 length:558 start_codon:yes stop_codon:yes gene_type:complete
MMIREVPQNFKLTYSQEDIAYRVYKMAGQMRHWVKDAQVNDGQQVLAICILRGGVFFFADLLKQIPYTVEPSFCRAMSYSSESNTQSEEFRLVVEPAEMKGRHVLLVDDICDSGKTLKHLHAYALENGAKMVKTAVLIHRNHAASVYTPDYIGFEYTGTEWFAGYGMEDKNHNSNFPEVYTIPCQ